MRKRTWVVELKSRPSADGLQRLGRGVKLIVDRATSPQPIEDPEARVSKAVRVDDDVLGQCEVR
jgi:hypothetical protein